MSYVPRQLADLTPSNPARRQGLLAVFHIDLPLLAGVLLLCGFGLIVLYSASGENLAQVQRQAIRIVLALVIMLAVAQIAPTTLRRWSPWLYTLGVLMLIAVLAFGEVGKGAQRWLDLGVIRFQPSEMVKLAVPLMIAWYLAEKRLPPSLQRLAMAALMIAVPVLLIAKQPDLGTSLLIASSGVIVILLAGLRVRIIALLTLLGVGAAPVLWYFMHDYQKQRVLTFLNPENDPRYRDTIKDDLKSIPTMSLVMDMEDIFDQPYGIWANSEQRGRNWERLTSVEYFDPRDPDHGFHVNAAIRSQGGDILCGGKRVDRKGCFVEPTIVRARNDMPIVQEETFAPILYVSTFTDLDAAIGPDGERIARLLETGEGALASAGDALGLVDDNRAEIEALLRDLRETTAHLKAFSRQVSERALSSFMSCLRSMFCTTFMSSSSQRRSPGAPAASFSEACSTAVSSRVRRSSYWRR